MVLSTTEGRKDLLRKPSSRHELQPLVPCLSQLLMMGYEFEYPVLVHKHDSVKFNSPH